jgi:hypothetical protein
MNKSSPKENIKIVINNNNNIINNVNIVSNQKQTANINSQNQNQQKEALKKKVSIKESDTPNKVNTNNPTNNITPIKPKPKISIQTQKDQKEQKEQKENENQSNNITNNKPKDPRKRDAETQTEEIFFKLPWTYFKAKNYNVLGAKATNKDLPKSFSSEKRTVGYSFYKNITANNPKQIVNDSSVNFMSSNKEINFSNRNKSMLPKNYNNPINQIKAQMNLGASGNKNNINTLRPANNSK